MFDKPVLLEQVGVTKAPPDLAEWEEIGFVRYLQRKRLFLSARNVEETERVPSFAKEEEAETILALMQQSFEPYTSALPDLDTLRQDIRENRVLAAREGEKLLGFLRFGREKKVSVLWQIAVAPDGRGKGIGSGSNDYAQFVMPTTGYANMVLAFRLRASNTGAGSFQMQYSTDGVDFKNLSTGTYAYKYTKYVGGEPQEVSAAEKITDGVAKTSLAPANYISFTFDIPNEAANADRLYIRMVPGSLSAKEIRHRQRAE